MLHNPPIGVTHHNGRGQMAEGFQPFGRVLRDLLIERDITTGMGSPNWSAFAELLDGVHYETLRKAVTGERQPSPQVMQAAAEALGLDPSETFTEFALWQATRDFDPREVGVEAALDNLKAWNDRKRRLQR